MEDKIEDVVIDKSKKINCDQVAWLLMVADRYLPEETGSKISKRREMLKLGMLYEIMDILELKFLDDEARWNGTPRPARDYRKINDL